MQIFSADCRDANLPILSKMSDSGDSVDTQGPIVAVWSYDHRYDRPPIEIPEQIHQAGMMAISNPPQYLPPRNGHKEEDIQAVMAFVLPGFHHLVAVNMSYLRNLTQDKFAIHPFYVDAMRNVLEELQTHHQSPRLLDFRETNLAVFARLDAFFIDLSRDWFNIIRQVIDQHAMQDSASRGKRVLDLYIRALDYFRCGMGAVDYICTPMNDKWLILHELSMGGYLWLSQVERDWVKRAHSHTDRIRRVNEMLKRWGYAPERGTQTLKDRADAINCAEAATDVNVPVPVKPMGLRRWRMEVLEPMLAQGDFDDVLAWLETQSLEIRADYGWMLAQGFNSVGLNPNLAVVKDVEALIP